MEVRAASAERLRENQPDEAKIMTKHTRQAHSLERKVKTHTLPKAA